MGGGASIPASFTDVSAFEGAAKAIVSNMETSGSILSNEALKIVLHYQAVAETVAQHFPGAKDGKFILSDAQNVLSAHNIDSKNTLFAQSVCPDEINHEQGDITQLFSNHIGEVFHMGGLARIPFTGKTGFAAFSHHVPDHGNLFVLMAPHIGVSNTCQLGKYSRDGQAHDGAACGAAVGAYNLCCSKAKEELPELFNPANASDYQMNYIVSEIFKCVEIIKAKEEPNQVQAELVSQCYDIAKRNLDECLSTNFGAGKLIVLAGIQINMPRPMNDYFQPRAFYILQKDKDPVDLFAEAFLK